MSYTTTNGLEITDDVAHELQAASQRVRGAFCADRLWKRHMTESEREQLGGNLEKAYMGTGTVCMWAKLRKTTIERATLDVARLLNVLTDSDYRWLLREVGEAIDAEEQLAQSIKSGDLVVVERDREVYWHGEQIDVDWHRHNKLWEFFWTLAENGKAKRGVDNATFGAFGDSNVITKRKNRLKNLPNFPHDLWQCIQRHGRQTQILDLATSKIHLFREDITSKLEEITG